MPSTDAPSSTAALAARLGLSRWAVSRALNRQPGVSQETVARVHSAIADSGFAPDPFARGLRGARTGVVALAVPAFDHAPALLVAAALQRELGPHGFHLALSATGGDQNGEEGALRWFASRRVEAVMMAFAGALEASSPGLRALRERGVPAFLIEPRAGPRLPGVTVARVDHRQAMMLGVRHLHALGHRRLALAGFGGPDSPDPRAEALRQACEEHGISCRDAVRWVDEEAGASSPHQKGLINLTAAEPCCHRGKALAAALTKGRAAGIPTAVIAADDALALGISQALRNAGNKVPQDFSVVGYGNGPLAECGEPALTTVDPQLPQAVPRLAALLHEFLRAPGRVETGTVWANPLLVRRESTASVRPEGRKLLSEVA